jgi:large subunit ribosomal protein L25
MTQQTLPATLRDNTGKGASRALRRQGQVPAIIYGGKGGELNVAVEHKEVHRRYRGGHFLSEVLQLDTGKEKIAVLPRDVQLHPVTDKIEHIDFLRIVKGEKVRVDVPVRLLNIDRSPGVKRGGTINLVRHEIGLYCDPDHIPSFIPVDLTGLAIGHSIHISHITLPKDATPVITDRDFTILALAGRSAQDDADNATAAPAAEGAAEGEASEEGAE